VGIAPSGRQFEIAWGRQRATVVELGAGIREYSVGERQGLSSRIRCTRSATAPMAPC
jgi:aldose 1-epimerase